MEIPVTVRGMEGQKVALRAGIFTGPKLMVNDQLIAKQQGMFYARSDKGANIGIKLKGRFLDPIPNLIVNGETIVLAPPLAWYQYVCMGIPIVLVFFGGAVGGFFGGLAAAISGRLFRSNYSEGMKYALTGLTSLGAFLAYFVVFGTIVTAMHK